MRRNTEWNFQETFVRILDERVPREPGGKRKTQSKRDVILAHILQKAIEGNSSLLALLLEHQMKRSGKTRRQAQQTRTKKQEKAFLKVMEDFKNSRGKRNDPEKSAQELREYLKQRKIEKGW